MKLRIRERSILFFKRLKKTNPNLTDNLEPFIYKLLQGSYQHCFFGDSTLWASMMQDNSSVIQFTEKYDAYFIEDFRWTKHNWDDMSRSPLVYQKWWNTIKNWRSKGCNLELQSIDEFIEEFDLDLIDKKDRKKLLDSIFEAVYKKYIKRLFISGKIEYYTKEQQLTNAFLRFMMAQSIIFFQFENFYESTMCLDYIKKALPTSNLEMITCIREFYNSYLEHLMNANLITPDDAKNYEQVCPLFNPMYVDYDHNKEKNSN